MSGYPHGLTAPHGDALLKPGRNYVLRGNEIKPVLHIISWCEDGVATVRWCGSKYLFDPVVLEAGETKPCPMCAIELHYDRAKKEVVEGGFPKVSPTEPGGGMTTADAIQELRAHFQRKAQHGDDCVCVCCEAIEVLELATRAAMMEKS